jgi:BirA family biotin operon repressor/biotin-[acetyl-CoA-carboxylase] ligase
VRRLPEREAVLAGRRPGRRLGSRVEWWDRLPSTQTELRQRAEAGAAEGLVLVAELQSQGRGQRSNSWASPEGGLWFSVLLRPAMSPDEVVHLMPACGHMVAELLGRELGLTARVKHPNDVLVDGRKVCGILAEAVTHSGSDRPAWVILGVGLNRANEIPDDLRGRAVSLAELLGSAPPAEELLDQLLDGIEGLL